MDIEVERVLAAVGKRVGLAGAGNPERPLQLAVNLRDLDS
jgi:hypothetical protein